MRILLAIAGVLVGVVAGSIAMMAVHLVSMSVYPPPEGVDPMSWDEEMREKVVAWVATLPAGAWLFAWLAHQVGNLVGAAVATLISGRRSIVPAMVIGAWFTLGGVMSAIQMESPAWFYVIDWPLYLVGAFCVARLLRREAAPAA